METRISILMGIYNCSKTLSVAIDSILAQTYQGWKMILCDDGSTDDTYKVAENYKNRYPDKFILIRNTKNQGLNYTLNQCLKHVDTEFVARMDGDDVSLPTRLEKEMEFLEEHPEYAIVSCPMIYFDDKGDYKIGKGIPQPTKFDLLKGTPFCHAPCMVRAEAIRRVGGYSVSNWLLRVEDYHLWYKMYSSGYIGANLLEPLYKMRDDRDAYNRRKFRYRCNEVYVKILIYRKFNMSAIKAIYILKPIIVGLLPSGMYHILHRQRLYKE